MRRKVELTLCIGGNRSLEEPQCKSLLFRNLAIFQELTNASMIILSNILDL